MALPLNALQAAIYTRLTAYSPLTTALGGAKIYDHVPQSITAPFVVIGEDTAIAKNTKVNNGWEITITIHCWDFEKAGRKSVKNLMSHIFDALNEYLLALSGSGFSNTYLMQEFAQSFQETSSEGANDHYYHGVQRFRALINDNLI